MNNTVSILVNEIIEPITINKIASTIVSPCLEKEAANGLAAFGEALTGSKARRIKGEYDTLAHQMLERTKNPKLHETYNEVEKAKNVLRDSSVHERMQGVKSNLEEKEREYRDTVRSHDETLNHYSGIRSLLRPVSPEYLGAKVDILHSKLGLRNAKAQYRAQERRLRGDLHGELSTAERRFDDEKIKAGTHGLDDKLKQKEKELQHAQEATSSARRITGLGVAGAAGGAYYLNKKNNPSPGPYSFNGDYPKYAEADNELVEKIASDILQSIYDR